jgi:AmmeMemoRadiSam system protein A
MSTLTDEDRKKLLEIARFAISTQLENPGDISLPKDLSPTLMEHRGCFVTLHKNGDLRGCIGNIEPTSSLAEGVKQNAINAAFKDPRFSPLKKDELPDVTIEISLLTIPRVIDFEDGEDLKRQLQPGIHGVILSKGFSGATFLPQVWEQLPDKEIFLEHLCQKGGLGNRCWQDTEMTVKVYEAEYFSE